MDNTRWYYLMHKPQAELTEDEFKDGWHFCYEWDGLLIGPDMDEMDCCLCDLGRQDGEQ